MRRLIALILAVPALAAARKPLRVDPWVFNPDGLAAVIVSIDLVFDEGPDIGPDFTGR